MSYTLAPVDVVILAAYLLGLLYTGALLRRPAGERREQFLLGGRQMTLVPFIATLVSTWYGGILGVGEFTYRHGLVNLVVFGLPYYLFAFLYAVYLAPKIRGGADLTIPDRLRRRFGPQTALFGASLVFLLATPAPYLLMLAVLINLVIGLPLWLGLIVGALLSTAYLWRSGFAGVVRTDLLQAGLMFTGFGALVFLLTTDMSPLAMWNALPAGHRNPLGADSMSWQVILVWFLIASWTFVDPGFYQRSAAARDPATARRGILISIALWFVFDILTTTAGLYAVLHLPTLGQTVAAYPALADLVLPAGLKGLFLVALLAVIMSTIDSYTFIGGTTLGRDVWPAGGERLSEQGRIRWGMALALVLGVLLAWGLPSVVGLWFTIGTLLVPGLLVPVLLTFSDRWQLGDRQALLVGGGGLAMSALWYFVPRLFAGAAAPPAYLWGLEPMLPGLMVSVLLAALWVRRSA